MIQSRSFPGLAKLAAFCLGLSFSVAWAAAPPDSVPTAPSTQDVELIVLLAAGPSAPTPEALVADVNRGQSPFHLPVQPSKARTALPFRASGETLAQLRAHPDSPRARLERYVILSFPPGVN